MTDNPIRDAIAEAIAENEVILFMKGTPDAPGVRLLRPHGRRAAGARRRRSRPSTSSPTRASARSSRRSRAGRRSRSSSSSGELVGGCDIVIEMYESGELAQTLGVDPATPPAEPPIAAEEGGDGTGPAPRRCPSRTAWAAGPRMAVAARPLRAVRWDGQRLSILDQTRLPAEEVWLRLHGAADTAAAIKRLAVRGAPLIGIAAAYGLALGSTAGRAGTPSPRWTRAPGAAHRPPDRGEPRRRRRPGPRGRAARPARRRWARRPGGGRGAARRGGRRDTAMAAHGADVLLAGARRPPPSATPARWPPGATARPWRSSSRCTRRGGASRSWPARRARCCRAPG